MASVLRFGLLLAITQSLFAQKLEDAPYTAPSYSDKYVREPTLPKPSVVVHLSRTGNDTYDGSKDRPVKTFDAAKRLVRKHRQQGHPDGGIEVRISPGTYHFKSSFSLTNEDSGTPGSPTIWRAASPGKTILQGGTSLPTDKLTVISDPETLARLHPEARGKACSLPLPDLNPDLFWTRNGPALLAMNGHMLQAAQWPNVGYHHIKDILEMGPTTRWLKPGEKAPVGKRGQPVGGKFTFKESLNAAVEKEFEQTGRIIIEGYPSNDWYFQTEPVGQIKDGVIQLQSATRYGINDGIKSLPRRLRLVNVLAELDQPGEWYFDHKNQSLIIWPVPGVSPSDATLSIPGGPPLLSLDGVDSVVFQNLVFENSGREAVQIRSGSRNLIAGSIFRNGLGHGVRISGGKEHGITGCDFHDLRQAFSLSGGDMRSLTPCHHFATNNRIHNCRHRGYGVIGLSGVGIYFAHNLLHDMNGAISFNSIDLLMEYNEFYNIGYEMGDFNVAYCGAQWHSMNNVLRYNFVHHILEPGGHPICPFRNDDGGAGLKIFGNVFYRTGRCAAQFHGPANTLQNNISLNAPVFWWTIKRPISPEAVKAEWQSLDRFGTELPKGDKGDFLYNLERRIGKEGWLKPPWKDRFPEVAKFIKTNPFAQTLCYIEKNYATQTRTPFHIHGGDGTVKGMEDRRTGKFADLPEEGVFELPVPITEEAFRDLSSLDLRFKESFLPMTGFHPIPFEKIGLYQSAYRPAPPDRTSYRKATFEKFKADTKRGYNPKVVNARYPVPEYLQ